MRIYVEHALFHARDLLPVISFAAIPASASSSCQSVAGRQRTDSTVAAAPGAGTHNAVTNRIAASLLINSSTARFARTVWQLRVK